VGSARAHSGPPPPRITILPFAITYDGADLDGNPVSFTQQLMNEDGTVAASARAAGGAYEFCDDGGGVPSVSCYDDTLGIARLEVPEGATVTFQAFYDQCPGCGRTGPIEPGQFASMETFVNDLRSVNGDAVIRLDEVMSRSTGNAFSNGNGWDPMMIVHWSNVDPEEPIPPGFSVRFHAATEIPRPATWAGDSRPFLPADQRWYNRAETIDGSDPERSREVVERVILHMGSNVAAGEVPPAWLALETDTSGKLRRLHAWYMTNGRYDAIGRNMILQLDVGNPDSVASTWNWDVPPDQLGGWSAPAGLPHQPVNGRPDSGVGFSSEPEFTFGPSSAADFAQAFRVGHRYETPSEPGGYMMRSSVQFKWLYGSFTSPATEAWDWKADLTYLGALDLEAANLDSTSGSGATVSERVEYLRALLSKLPGDPAIPSPPAGFDITDLNAADVTGSLKQELLVEVLTPAEMDALTGGVGPTMLGFTGAEPSVTMAFPHSGTFPQTSGSSPPGAPGGPNGEKPGYAYVVVRDTSPPRHYRFVETASDSYPITGGEPPRFEEGQTGRTLAATLREAGRGTHVGVEVFDNNPALVAFGGGLPGYADAVAAGVAPAIEVWYAVQKAGYDFRVGRFFDLAGVFVPPEFRDVWTFNRHAGMGGDSQLAPRPSFRFYPATDPDGNVRRYQPVGYRLVEAAQPSPNLGTEPLASVLVYDVDLEDLREPMGLHFAEGALPGEDPGVIPGWGDGRLVRLFMRPADGRLARGAGAGLIDWPAELGFGTLGGEVRPFEQPNFLPSWLEEVGPDDRPLPAGPRDVHGLHFATRPFPEDGDEQLVPRRLDSDVGVARSPSRVGSLEAALASAAVAEGFAETDGLDGGSQGHLGRAATIRVEDVVPPTVVLVVTDTKHDRSAFFGNRYLGDMAYDRLQQLLQAESGGADRTDVLPVDAAEVFPEPGLGELDPCATGQRSGCLLAANDGLRGWRFVFDAGGAAAADFAAQQELWFAGGFHPMSYYASPARFGGGASPVAQMEQPRGLWVDEDTRLLFRVLAWDNLNAHLGAVEEVDGLQNLYVFGANAPRLGRGLPYTLDVRVYDPASGNSELSLADGGNELADGWPGYAFRNPNRLARGDGSGQVDVTGARAGVEVDYVDGAGNRTTLAVELFVVENTLRIRSLQEDRRRTWN